MRQRQYGSLAVFCSVLPGVASIARPRAMPGIATSLTRPRMQGNQPQASWLGLLAAVHESETWPISEMAVARVGGRLLGWSCRHCGIRATRGNLCPATLRAAGGGHRLRLQLRHPAGRRVPWPWLVA